MRGLFERRPFATYQSLIETAAEVMGALRMDEIAQVIDAHPRIGASRRDLLRGSGLSYAEQGDAEARVAAELRKLNQSYERRFGFRFVVFVNRRSQAALLPVLRARLGNGVEEERRTALADILAIARDRLRKLSQ
jgi:2-oxo-4-hydroxy-4-carboxy--5-ureidoimidazoline (OHCU) decarboxylase